MISALIVSSILSASLPSEIEGRWVQPCQSQAIREEVLQNNSATLTEKYYQDTTCSEPLLTFKNEGALAAQNGEMDFTFTRITLALHAMSLVEDFNERAVCGRQDWSRG